MPGFPTSRTTSAPYSPREANLECDTLQNDSEGRFPLLSRRAQEDLGKSSFRKAMPLKSAVHSHDPQPLRRSFPPLAGRIGGWKFLRSLQARQELVLGSLLAGGRVFFVDYRPLAAGSTLNQRFARCPTASID